MFEFGGLHSTTIMKTANLHPTKEHIGLFT